MTIRVLHTDDDEELADIAATLLEAENDRFSVDIAHNAQTGLERCETTEYDCIVSDYEMDGMNGVNFLEQVRERDREIPFILFTGKGSEEIASHAISAGVTDYLQKETGTEQFELLANRVNNAVSQYRAERQAAKQGRLLEILRQINQSLLETTTTDDVATCVSDILGNTEPYQLAIFGEFADDPERIIPRVANGIDTDSLVPITGDESDGNAVFETLQSGCIRVAEQPSQLFVDWSAVFPEDAVGGTAVLPIVYRGTRYGILALYTDRVDIFDEDERAMLDEIAGDITQAYHAAVVREELRQHETAVRAVPEGVFLLDEHGLIDLVNEAAADLFHTTPEEAIGEPFPSFVQDGIVDSEILDWYIDSLRTMLSSANDRDEAWFETVIHPPEGPGKEVKIHLALRPYEDDFRGTVGVIRQVTDPSGHDT